MFLYTFYCIYNSLTNIFWVKSRGRFDIEFGFLSFFKNMAIIKFFIWGRTGDNLLNYEFSIDDSFLYFDISFAWDGNIMIKFESELSLKFFLFLHLCKEVMAIVILISKIYCLIKQSKIIVIFEKVLFEKHLSQFLVVLWEGTDQVGNLNLIFSNGG